MSEHILLAEDDAGLRLSLSFVLKNKGYRITACVDGREALERLSELRERGETVDALITDIQMPGMNGMELIRRLKNDGREFPIIVITGHGDKEMLIELLRLGCDDYLSKPFEPGEVQDKVAQVLEKKRASEQQREREQSDLRKANLRLDREVQAYRRDLHDLRGEMARAVRTYSDLMDVDRHGFKVPLEYRSRPYRDLGGDYMGICDTEQGCNVLVADVAGHDLAASYQTVLIKSQFDESCRLRPDGGEFFQKLNRELIANSREERMVTAQGLNLNLVEGTARVVSAGHPRMLLRRAGARSSESVPVSGSVLGLMDEVEFGVVELEIHSGDRFFLYTDGLLNAHSVDGPSGERRVLGERGLLRALDIFSDLDLSDQVQSVWRFARSFCRYRQSDDMLLLGIQIP
ncbi:MAG: PP2C family protein-serine/threonine phosphatase [Desulfovibrio sp.]